MRGLLCAAEGEVRLSARTHSTIIIGSAEALPILCVRCARRERERERERERDTEERERERERERESETEVTSSQWRWNWRWILHLFLPKISTLVLTKSLHFSLPKICTSVSPLLKGAEFTLSVAKNAALFETVRVLRLASVKWRDRGSKHRNKRSNFRLQSPSFHRKNESN